jgi:hypothetical protein
MSHGANYSGHQVRPPQPIVDPRRVAAALVALRKRPRNATFIGAPALPGILAHALAPNLVGRVMMLIRRALGSADPAARTDGNLFERSRGNAIDGGFRSSHGLHPAALALGVGAALVGALALAASRTGGPRNSPTRALVNNARIRRRRGF